MGKWSWLLLPSQRRWSHLVNCESRWKMGCFFLWGERFTGGRSLLILIVNINNKNIKCSREICEYRFTDIQILTKHLMIYKPGCQIAFCQMNVQQPLSECGNEIILLLFISCVFLIFFHKRKPFIILVNIIT